MNENALINKIYHFDKCQAIANRILNKVKVKPIIALVCGTGFGDVVDLIEDGIILPFQEIDDFPNSSVHGHRGNFVFGNLNSIPMVAMQGRLHQFEGWSAALCTVPIKIFKLMGVKLIFLTSAVGSINDSYNVGDLMVVRDHLSFPQLAGNHPLTGLNDERFGPRFVPTGDIYKKKYRDILKQLDGNLHEGVLATVSGPSYETPSDANFLKLIGVDAVGMSVSHEAIMAAYCEIDVVALVMITNKVAHANHEEVLQVAQSNLKRVQQLILNFLKRMYQDGKNELQATM